MIQKWIQSVVVFLLLMSLVGQLIPVDKYRKYVKLTMGLVFILVMLAPMTQLLDMDEKVFVNLIQSEMYIAQAEAKASEAVLDTSNVFVKQYESLIAEEIIAYFKADSVNIKECEVILNEDSGSLEYGSIEYINILILPVDQSQYTNESDSDIRVNKVDIDVKKKRTKDSGIPDEKKKEWRQDLLLWFDLEEDQLKLEIVS